MRGKISPAIKQKAVASHSRSSEDRLLPYSQNDIFYRTKSYMHVYRTNEFQKDRQIVLYKYSPGRGHKVAGEFLEGFHGYHSYFFLFDCVDVTCTSHKRCFLYSFD